MNVEERPKIAIDAREMLDWATGIGKYVHNLLDRLPELDPTIDYYFLRNGRPIDNFKTRTPNAQFVVSPEYADDQWEQGFVPSFLQSHEIDLFHSPRSGFVAFWPPGRPYVVTLHDLIPLLFPEKYSSEWIQRIRDRVPDYLARAEKIITVSYSVKKDVQSLIPVEEDKFQVIHQGIEAHYGPVAEEVARPRLRERFKLEGNYIFYIGGFSFRKNVTGLVKAYSILPEHLRQGYRLVIGGYRTDDFDEVVRCVEELGLQERVLFTGRCSEVDIPCLYSGAALFVYPSLYEGFGLPPLEAMACRTPVITSDRGSLPEIAGKGALMVNPCDHRQLSEAMARVLTDEGLRRALIEKGLAVVSQFSWDRNARETLEVYRAVLGKLRT
ncbi:MAG: glycosyltransferase family 4 protein [Firmicutes bacterium]|nr:glycosyltransferase family 4 protein [Bacillota bacterium]